MENNQTPQPDTQTNLRPGQALLSNTYTSFVNLAHRKDRLELMEAELERRSLRAVRTPGLRPHEVSDVIVPARRVRTMQNRTPGAIGCHFAQVSVMEEALRRGRHAWVMEDDLKICADIHQRLDHISIWMDSHPWDIIWMGGTFHVNPPHWHKGPGSLMRDAECTDDPRMVRTYGCFCTYSYIVNRDSISKVLAGLDSVLDRSIGIDWAMIQLQPKWNTFSFVPGCCTQRDNKSDIGKGWTYFSGFKKLGPYWWALHMESFDPTTFNWHEAAKR